MILINDISKKNLSKGVYVSLGSFDGIHKGHLVLINKAIELAKKNDALSMVYTFKNHPLSLINKNKAPKLLMDNNSKEQLLKTLGVDILYFAEFNEELMQMDPKNFIKDLVSRFNIKGIIVGFNYRFGYKNSGDLKLLNELSKILEFDLYIIDAYLLKNKVVSSTRIRECIKNGWVGEALEMLDKPFELTGIVVSGKKLGRTIGFPTANLSIDKDIIIPKIGVYYTNVEYKKKVYKGITSIGNNPTVNGKNITIETNILDFDEDLYGKEIKVFFIKRIRDEKKFANLNELREQLKKDKKFAKEQCIESNL